MRFFPYNITEERKYAATVAERKDRRKRKMQKKNGNRNGSVRNTTSSERLGEFFKLAAEGGERARKKEAGVNKVWKVYLPEVPYQKVLAGRRRMLIARQYIQQDAYPGQKLDLINLDDTRQHLRAVVRQMITYADFDDLLEHAPLVENGYETREEAEEAIRRLKTMTPGKDDNPAAVVILFELLDNVTV